MKTKNKGNIRIYRSAELHAKCSLAALLSVRDIFCWRDLDAQNPPGREQKCQKKKKTQNLSE